MSALQERGEIATPEGRQSVSILLFEDLLIVPLLAIVAVLSPLETGEGGLMALVAAIGGIAALLAAGRWLLGPFFALLARARTREVLTAGALLVVLGAALLMQAVGLSMAMGAFLAGVMLSGSSYRHQIEADIEPFRGLLMGLFFLAVGMSLDLSVVAREWPLLVGLLVAFIVVKSLAVYGVARLWGSSNRGALHRTAMFAQGGEFAFVLYTAAASSGVIDARENAVFSTVVILSMAVTPLILMAADRLLKGEAVSLDGVEEASDLHGQVLMVGFGRFGQIAVQLLLSRGVQVSVIENDPNRIREAQRFGFTVFLRRWHAARHPACIGRRRGASDHRLRRRSQGGQRHRIARHERVPERQGAGAQLRSRALDRTRAVRGRLRNPRDGGIRLQMGRKGCANSASTRRRRRRVAGHP